AVPKHKDAAEIQLSPRSGPQSFQSGAASRHEGSLQTETLGGIGGAARSCGVNRELRKGVARYASSKRRYFDNAVERLLPSEAGRPFSNVSDRCPAIPRRPWHASPRMSSSRLVGLPFIAAQSPVRPRERPPKPKPVHQSGNSNSIHRSFYDRFKKILIDGCVVSYGSPWSSGESHA